MKNIIQFRNGFVNLPDHNQNNKQLAITILCELMKFGFILDESAINNISRSTKEEIVSFHNDIVSYLKRITGSGYSYRPFYSNFPEEVMNMTECELLMNQVLHYISHGQYLPNQIFVEKKEAFEQPSYQTIVSGDENRFLNIFERLLSINQSLTSEDIEVIKWFISSGNELRIPKSIPFKENLVILIYNGINLPLKLTVTDVMRVCVGLSGGDVSNINLPNKSARISNKFKKFNRSERKTILSLLENTNCDPTEAVLYKNRWIRLGEILHVGEFKNQFPNSYGMFSKIRNEKVRSFYSEIDSSFNQSFENGLKTLSKRPGLFIRQLDSLIRKSDSIGRKMVLDTLSDISVNVSNKVLYESFIHFDKRIKVSNKRTIMLKGGRKKVDLPILDPLPIDIVNEIKDTIKNSLMVKFSSLGDLNKVFLDEELKKIPLPTNMRSLTPTLRPIIRGQRKSIGNTNTKVIRSFLHWFDENGVEDLDLTVTLIGMGKIDHFGWNGSRDNSEIGVYSGDMRFVVGPVAEYVDINISEALKNGYKYCIIDANNYTNRPFHTVKDCVIGFMERENQVGGEIFIPSTINNCIRINNDSSTTVIGVVDLESMEYIHIDVDRKGFPVTSTDFDGLINLINQYIQPPSFSVYDLIKLHVNARNGQLINNKDEADHVFTYDDFSNSYVNTMELMGV